MVLKILIIAIFWGVILFLIGILNLFEIKKYVLGFIVEDIRVDMDAGKNIKDTVTLL